MEHDHQNHLFKQEKRKIIDVWNAVDNLKNDLQVSSDELLRSLMGWIGDWETRDWLEKSIERDYDLTFDSEGNIELDTDE